MSTPLDRSFYAKKNSPDSIGPAWQPATGVRYPQPYENGLVLTKIGLFLVQNWLQLAKVYQNVRIRHFAIKQTPTKILF
jgi:hypothetical protein